MPSFDIIGNREKAVAIIELNDKVKKKARIIAHALMQQHKNVASVLLKESARKGKYRIRKMKLIGGQNNTEVIHKESSCSFILDPRKVYFSQREVTERQRIAEKRSGSRALSGIWFCRRGGYKQGLSGRWAGNCRWKKGVCWRNLL